MCAEAHGIRVQMESLCCCAAIWKSCCRTQTPPRHSRKPTAIFLFKMGRCCEEERDDGNAERYYRLAIKNGASQHLEAYQRLASLLRKKPGQAAHDEADNSSRTWLSPICGITRSTWSADDTAVSKPKRRPNPADPNYWRTLAKISKKRLAWLLTYLRSSWNWPEPSPLTKRGAPTPGSTWKKD